MIPEGLLDLAREVLGCTQIDPDRGFLELGGDSLGAIRMSRGLRNVFGADIDAMDVIECGSLRVLGGLVAAECSMSVSASSGPVVPLPARPAYAVSPVQEGLYLLDRMTPGHDSVTLPTVLSYNTALSPVLAERAFRDVLTRHEILRTTFAHSRGRVVQVVHEAADSPLGFDFTDFTDASAPPETADDALRVAYEAALTERLDPATGPLVRLSLVVLSPAQTVGFLTMHHIVSDDYSAAVVDADLRRAYDRAAGRTLLAHGLPEAAELTYQYRDYAQWLQDWIEGPEGREALSYWESALPPQDGRVFGDFPVTDQSYAAERVDLPLGDDLRALLVRTGAQHNATLFVTMASCLKVLLLSHHGAPEAILGVAMTTGNAGPQSEHIGPYVNTLPVAAPITPSTTFRQLLSEMAESTRGAFAHRTLPVERLGERLARTGSLFDVGFTLQKRDHPDGGHGEQVTDLSWLEQHGRVDGLGIQLLFTAFEEPGRIRLRIRYRTAHFRRPEILTLYAQLARVIEAVSASPDVPLAVLTSSFAEAAPVPRSVGTVDQDLDLDLGPLE